jgi:Flp pilus assembly protein TadB
MNDKIINISSKGLMLVIIVVGVVLSAMVMSYGNPGGMKKPDTDALGLEIAKNENADKSGMTQQELNTFIEDAGVNKQKELLHDQGDKVSSTLNFSKWVLYLAVILIVVALVLAIVGSPKKYIVGMIGVGVFVALIAIIYSMAGTDVPESLTIAESAKLNPGEEGLFTGDNWKVAGASMVSMMVLIVLAVVTIVGSEVYKMIKG